jgi:antitoxin YefM
MYVLQNSELMKQIADSMATNSNKKGYKLTVAELDEITGI